MTTLKANISHKQELDSAIDDLIDQKGKYCSIDKCYSLSLQDIDIDDHLNLCRLAIECKDRDLEDTFCNNLDNMTSALLNVLHIGRYESVKEDEGKLIDSLKVAVIIENESYLEKLIEDRCEDKMINEKYDGDLYNHYYG